MTAELIRFRLTGERPLLMHSSRLVDPLDPISNELARLTAKRAKTNADQEEIARVEWRGGLWLFGGRPCIPAEAIEATFLGAAKINRKGKHARAGFLVPDTPLLQYPGSTDLEALYADPAFRFRFPVRVNDARVMRTRARFATWHVDVTAEYLPGLFSAQDVFHLLEVAGFREGLGDWRPRFGRFSVRLLE